MGRWRYNKQKALTDEAFVEGATRQVTFHAAHQNLKSLYGGLHGVQSRVRQPQALKSASLEVAPTSGTVGSARNPMG